MSIWTYADGETERDAIGAAVGRTQCPFCKTALDTLLANEGRSEPFRNVELQMDVEVRACPVCGWWVLKREEYTLLHRGPKRGVLGWAKESPPPHELRVFGASACLKQLSLNDLSIPATQVQDYLAAKYDARLKVHPRKFEEVVGSVFGGHGYRARVTAYSGDKGIDVILDGKDDAVVGVQVKRTKNRIEVRQIRELAGALVQSGMTRGIFVTTSTFRSGAEGTVQELRRRGVRITLMDAPRFFDALQIAQRERYRTRKDEGAPFLSAGTVLLSSRAHPVFNSNFARRMSEDASRLSW